MIVGFHFTKISVERYAPLKGKISVRNDVDITGVQEQPLSVLDDNQKALSFSFAFRVIYSPKVADVILQGTVLYAADAPTHTTILSSWKSKKKVPADVSVEVLNFVLQQCNIRALALSQELNLPSHLPLPRYNPHQQHASAYIG